MIKIECDDLIHLLDIFLIIKIAPILNWLAMVFATMNQTMLTAILMVVIAQQQHQLQPCQLCQQLEDATRDGLVIIFVMISITTLAAAMMEGIVVDVMLTLNTAQSADALTQMETGAEQLAHQLLLPSQVCQQLLAQVVMIQHCWCFDFALGSNFKK